MGYNVYHSKGMIKIIKRLNMLLDRKQKIKMVLIVFLMLIGGILESLSISVAVAIPVLRSSTNCPCENPALVEIMERIELISATL